MSVVWEVSFEVDMVCPGMVSCCVLAEGGCAGSDLGVVNVPDRLDVEVGRLIHAILFLGPVRWGGGDSSEDSDDMLMCSLQVGRIVRER